MAQLCKFYSKGSNPKKFETSEIVMEATSLVSIVESGNAFYKSDLIVFVEELLSRGNDGDSLAKDIVANNVAVKKAMKICNIASQK